MQQPGPATEKAGTKALGTGSHAPVRAGSRAEELRRLRKAQRFPTQSARPRAARGLRRPWFDVALALTAGLACAALVGTAGVVVGALACVALVAVWAGRGHAMGAVLCALAFAGHVQPDGPTEAQDAAAVDRILGWTWGAQAPGGWRLREPRAGRVLPAEDRLLPPLEALEAAALGGDARRVASAVGLAHPGERVVWLPSTPPLPFAAPTPESRARLSIEPAALVRVAPAPVSLAGLGLGWLWGRLGPERDGLDGSASPRARLLVAAAQLEAGARLPHGLGQALWLGETGALDPEVRDLFTRTGTRHLLAISGLHVGIVALLLLWPLVRALVAIAVNARRAVALATAVARDSRGSEPGSGNWRAAGRRSGSRRGELLLLGAGLAVFVGLAGAGAPVWRASVVVALGLAAREVGAYGRRVDGLNLWGVALALEWLLGERRFDDLSLQLSYTAAAGLLLFFAPVARATRRSFDAVLGWMPGLEAWRPRWARRPWTSLVRGAARVVALSFAASLVAVGATLPLTSERFGEWAPVGLILTGACLPPLAWLLVIGWPLTVLVHWFPELANLGVVLTPAADLFGALLEAADGLPGTPWSLPSRPAWLVALPLLALALGRTLELGGRRERRVRFQRGLTAVAWAALAALLLPWTVAPAQVEVRVLPVGHGTAVALRTEGGETWIFDAGSRDRLGVLGRSLRPLLAEWESPPPHIVLSHGDRDHWSALAGLVRRQTPAVWVGHVEPELELPSSVPRLDIVTGRMLLREGSTRLTLLRGGPFPGNEGSRSLLVEHGDRRLLLCGDAEAEGLAALLADWPDGQTVDVLLMPHHGSDMQLLEPLLDALQPQEVWISKGGPAQLEAELHRRGLVVRTTAGDTTLRWPDSSR